MSRKNLEMSNVYIIIHSKMLSSDDDKQIRKLSSSPRSPSTKNRKEKKERKSEGGGMVTDIPGCWRERDSERE